MPKERAEKEAKQKEVAKAALLNSLFNQATDKKGRAFDPAAKKKAKQEEEEAIVESPGSALGRIPWIARDNDEGDIG